MRRNGKGWEESFIHFKLYLTSVEKVAGSTADGYVKRIVAICREEGITPEELAGRIKELYYEYSEGSKKELGMRSHNTYRAALKHFYHYVIDHHGQLGRQSQQTTTSREPNYLIDVTRVPDERFGVIKLRDKDGTLLDTAAMISLETHSTDETIDDMLLKSLIMLVKTIYKKDSDGAMALIQTLGASLTMDGKKIF